MDQIEQTTKSDEEELPPDLINSRLRYAQKVLAEIFHEPQERVYLDELVEEAIANHDILSEYSEDNFLKKYLMAGTELHRYNCFCAWAAGSSQRHLADLFHTNGFFTNQQSLTDFGKEIVRPLINLYYARRNLEKVISSKR